MKITKIIEIKKLDIIAILCDKCLKEYSNPYEIQEFLHIDFTSGYGSVFGDGTKIEADICQYCLKNFLNNPYHTEEWNG